MKRSTGSLFALGDGALRATQSTIQSIFSTGLSTGLGNTRLLRVATGLGLLGFGVIADVSSTGFKRLLSRKGVGIALYGQVGALYCSITGLIVFTWWLGADVGLPVIPLTVGQK